MSYEIPIQANSSEEVFVPPEKRLPVNQIPRNATASAWSIEHSQTPKTGRVSGRAMNLCVTMLVACSIFGLAVPPTSTPGATPTDDQALNMKLWQEIDVSSHAGCYLNVGDLNGDSKVDFLLYRVVTGTSIGYMAAIDNSGSVLWTWGEAEHHLLDGKGDKAYPPVRAACTIFDLDGDGAAEVIVDRRVDGKATLQILEGSNGAVRHSADVPFVKNQSIRAAYAIHIAWLHGQGKPPSLVFKYHKNNLVPGQAAAYTTALKPLWYLKAKPSSVGHISTIADLDGDGTEEIVLGQLTVDATGKRLFETKYPGGHTDMTAVADIHPASGREVLLAMCNNGALYCHSAAGKLLWRNKKVKHVECVWVGDFLYDRPGAELLCMVNGHVGDYSVHEAKTGQLLGTFQQEKRGYPDWPVQVRWLADDRQCLWIPCDFHLVDGKGRVVARLGAEQQRVLDRLDPGASILKPGMQAIALDLCGDAREEVVLYHPNHGRSIFIFTQHDSDGATKPYQHQPNAYNSRSCN